MELSMHHRTLDEITQVATIFPAGKPPSSEVRRERLRRLATVLDEHVGPIHLLSEIEYLSRSDFSTARCDCSPLALAFEDSVLRRQGLTSDRLGDAMTFFGLSSFEAHHLFCDCHYGGSADPRIVAQRVRDLAEHRSIFEVARAIWSRLVAA
jgi:hypothetical protein